MIESTFKLRPNDEYIELIKLLKLKQLAQSGGHAKILIVDGHVKVNGVKQFQKRNKLRPGDVVELEETRITII